MKQKQWALITGASSGIGLELARVFAEHHYNLVLTARREGQLQQLAGDLEQGHNIKTLVIAADLADPAAPDAIFARLQEQQIFVDVLVNNAGFGTFGFFHATPLGSELQMLQVNITALTHLTGLFLPPMVAARQGRILNVASTAAFQAGPMMAVYYASKAYVLSFSEALANELAGSGISVTALCPGPTKSEFQSRAKMQDSKLIKAAVMDTREVALAGYLGLIRNKSLVIPGVRNALFANLNRFLPRRTITKIIRRVQDTKA